MTDERRPVVTVDDKPSADGNRTAHWHSVAGAHSYDIVLRPSLWHARIPVTPSADGTPSEPTVALPPLAPGDYAVEVRALRDNRLDSVGDDGIVRVPPRQASSTVLSRVSWGIFTLQAVATVACLIAAAAGAHHRNVLWDLAFSFGVLTLVFGLLQALGREVSWDATNQPRRTRIGLCRVVVGADGRVSASELQTALWTWLVAFLAAYFAARSWFDGVPHLFDGVDAGAAAGSSVTAWPAYLGLLGGPFVALVAARGIDASKLSDGSLQKAPADSSEPASLKQVLTNDNGSLSVIDTQYLVFNLVALAYVIAGLASTDRLPAIPGLLVTLTGSSAAAYVLNKAVTTSGPSLTSVVPSAITPGEDILLLGTNLIPAGARTPPMVTIGGMQALVGCDATSSRVTATVPVTLKGGTANVVVTTFAQAATDPGVVTVLPDAPVIYQATLDTTGGKPVLTVLGTALGIRDRSGQPVAYVIAGTATTSVKVEVTGSNHSIVFDAPPTVAVGNSLAVRTLRGATSAAVDVLAPAGVRQPRVRASRPAGSAVR